MVTHLPGLPATAAEGNASGGPFFAPAISLDGASVLYTSTAVDLVANQVDANGEPDVFVWDRLSSRNRLVSHIPGSVVTTGNAGAEVVALARKKLIAGFESAATNLVPVDGNAHNDVFLQVLLLFERRFREWGSVGLGRESVGRRGARGERRCGGTFAAARVSAGAEAGRH